MKKTEKAYRRYLRQVRRMLPCPRRVRQTLLSPLENNLKEFLAEHPDADFAQLKAQFGEPETIAAAYVENTEIAELLKSYRIGKRIVLWIAIVALAVVLLRVATMVGVQIEVDKSPDAYYTEEELSQMTGDIPPDDPVGQN